MACQVARPPPRVIPLGWYSPPADMGPPTITSLDELKNLGRCAYASCHSILSQLGPAGFISRVAGRYVAPILYGGLGNALFQLAATHVYAKTVGVPCVVGYFDHW
jgi:hypothetical protein